MNTTKNIIMMNTISYIDEMSKCVRGLYQFLWDIKKNKTKVTFKTNSINDAINQYDALEIQLTKAYKQFQQSTPNVSITQEEAENITYLMMYQKQLITQLHHKQALNLFGQDEDKKKHFLELTKPFLIDAVSRLNILYKGFQIEDRAYIAKIHNRVLAKSILPPDEQAITITCHPNIGPNKTYFADDNRLKKTPVDILHQKSYGRTTREEAKYESTYSPLLQLQITHQQKIDQLKRAQLKELSQTIAKFKVDSNVKMQIRELLNCKHQQELEQLQAIQLIEWKMLSLYIDEVKKFRIGFNRSSMFFFNPLTQSPSLHSDINSPNQNINYKQFKSE